MRIITGATGVAHVTSNDEAVINQAIFGRDSVILNMGYKLEANIVDNNTIKIKDGDLLLQGKHARIEKGLTENVSVPTGAIGKNRNDLIVARYSLDSSTGYEDISLIVIKGTETTGTAEDPSYNTGDILAGAMQVDFPLYRVVIEGVTITAIERIAILRDVIEDKIDEINNNLIASDRTPFRFGVNENGEYGYIITDSEGADSVIPFKSSVELLSFIGQTTSYGKGFNKTLNSDTEIAILFYSYTLHSGGGDGTTYLPTINGEYTLLDEKVVTESHWAYLYSKVIIIQKKKGDDNVIVTFPSTSEHYFSQGYIVEI